MQVLCILWSTEFIVRSQSWILTDQTGGLHDFAPLQKKNAKRCCIDLHVESVLLLELLGGLVQLVDGGLQLHLEGVHLLAVVADATVSLASL